MTTNPKDAFGGKQNASKTVGCVSQGIKIKGELTGTEDLFIDGNVEGKISLGNSVVTVGTSGGQHRDSKPMQRCSCGLLPGAAVSRVALAPVEQGP